MQPNVIDLLLNLLKNKLDYLAIYIEGYNLLIQHDLMDEDQEDQLQSCIIDYLNYEEAYDELLKAKP